jgi:cellulose 1,4-beta-cellobiosidase
MAKTPSSLLRAASVIALTGMAALAALTAAPPVVAESHQANPFVGAKQYVNPLWKASVEAEAARQSGSLASAMRTVENQPTAVWMDRIAAIAGPSGGMGLAAHLDAALTQGGSPMLITIVIYDLPGRDCAALASNGEIPATAAGLTQYKTQYIDPIATILSNSKYANLRIVTIIEPDSLPNIVTNQSVSACQTAGTYYEQGVAYALDKLHAISNVYNYLDAAHSGWLGWTSNSGPAASEFAKVANMTTAGLASIDGFITDTANTTPLQEPFITGTTTVNGQQAISSNYYQYNPDVDEQSFTADMYSKLVSAGFPSSIGMIIDTSRNGWGGPNRPSAASTSTDLNTWVNATRVDRRPHRGAWCNPSGAGIGQFPQATPGGYPNSHLDAYIWVKPPGESDGASTAIPNDQGKGFDRMCDPTYAPPGAGWNGALTGALPNAPLSGQWFSAQFIQLVQNAYPPVGQQPATPTPPQTATVPPSGSVPPTATPTIRPSGTATAPPTIPPTVPPTGGPASCSAAIKVDNSWGSGFQATVTVSNTGTSPTTSWKVTWSWPASQTLSNYWNATVTQSGAAVTANNLGYNGAIGAGGSTSFGLQVNGASATPSLSCAANGGVTPTPTVQPTATPTVRPSVTPTVRPSVTPTVRPSVTPTVRPSVTPTVRPSVTPTVRPSVTPTVRPSVTPTVRPSSTVPPTSGPVSCSATWRIDSSWGSGFNGTVTVTNSGTVATKSWTVKWTWPGSQTFVNKWNANVTQSGTAVTATNLTYNGAIAPAGSVSFGFQVNGASATPTLTCSAT